MAGRAPANAPPQDLPDEQNGRRRPEGADIVRGRRGASERLERQASSCKTGPPAESCSGAVGVANQYTRAALTFECLQCRSNSAR